MGGGENNLMPTITMEFQWRASPHYLRQGDKNLQPWQKSFKTLQNMHYIDIDTLSQDYISALKVLECCLSSNAQIDVA